MESLGINVPFLTAQAINFILFFILFTKYISKPFLEYIGKQKNAEKEREELTKKLQSQEKDYEQKNKELISEAKKERDSIFLEAKKSAENVKNDIIAEAKVEAENIIKRAKEQAESQKTELEKEMTKKCADMSVMIVSKALSNYLDEDGRKKVTDYIITSQK